ncbi:unnamed protein product [Clonostachys rosea]|uniref:FAD/NAD(P)-binding domain-containing protein n=1 Tax=Bionectria ochroleuca TaxID=29856 RepID=A0ABY6UHJ0_BIOOC|nr:unnamed protein product [Clonostachys rosea]
MSVSVAQKHAMVSTSGEHVLDALIVGAGFSGVYQLKHLRDEGYRVKLVDDASDYGGVWYWNRYPGARVDSTVPNYEFSDPDLWKEWSWKQRFPGSEEIRAYFAFVADKWDLRRDTEFNTYISKATWDDAASVWTIEAKDGRSYQAKFLLLNTGFAAKRHFPDWKGIEKFRGSWIHPSYWPKSDPDLRDKIAVIGTGATGVQLSQELSQVASEFVLFQRTPNLALPRKQINYTGDATAVTDDKYSAVFAGRYESFSGLDFDFLPRETFEDTPEQRRAIYEELWEEGDFHFWLATYHDMLFSEDANKEAYVFWKEKVRARIQDARARELLAPEKQPYGFGCKRIALEQGFFEIFNQPNVSLVDVNATPVVEVTERGIRTTEKEWEFDYIVCATGFDALTGGIMNIDIRGRSGGSITDKWKAGVKSYLGMAVGDFPNMFFTYGPQGPTTFCNGPTCAESQGSFIVAAMNFMKNQDLRQMDVDAAAEILWSENIQKIAARSLIPGTKSWYMGDNIPGKPRECLVYLGGVPNYYKALNECVDRDFEGFTFV